MWAVVKAAFMGVGLVFGSFFMLVLIGKGCTTVVSADELQPPPQSVSPVYEADPIYGYRYLDREVRPETNNNLDIDIVDPLYFIDVIPGSATTYVTCTKDQKYYQYVIDRYTKEDPVFWGDTIKLYQELIDREDCHL